MGNWNYYHSVLTRWWHSQGTSNVSRIGAEFIIPRMGRSNGLRDPGGEALDREAWEYLAKWGWTILGDDLYSPSSRIAGSEGQALALYRSGKRESHEYL